jgi:hypothetical protein
MKLSVRCAAFLLPLLLAGCSHKASQQQVKLAPPIEDAPPKPVTAPSNLPPPVITPPADTTKPADSTAEQQPAPTPPARHKKSANKNTQVGAVETPVGVSAVGQLSTGDAAEVRKQTVDAIAAIEHGLNGITKELSDQEHKTAAQIREFLKQAREALASGDVEGAQTLTLKAKVLLGELSP